LLGQVFVIDGKTKVADVLSKAGKDLGAPVSVAAFVRFQLGEGIEKEVSDFAAEVAAAAGA
jgi:elongation factor Ts